MSFIYEIFKIMLNVNFAINTNKVIVIYIYI